MSKFKRQSQSLKQTPSGVDGFIRRGKAPSPFRRPESSFTTKDSLADFSKSEGFVARRRGREDQVPDGTQLGRRPIHKKDLDLDLPGDMTHRKKPKKSRDKKKVLKRAALSMTALTILVGGYMIGMAFLKVQNVFQGGSASNVEMCQDIQPNQLTEEDQCRINMLVMGVDDAADLTDSMIVMSIDPVDNSAKLISIPRDTYVQSPIGGQSKINAVFTTSRQNAIAQGKDRKEAEKIGMNTLEEVIEEMLGIELHYYTTVNFEAFERAVDTVGGVTVDVQEPLYDRTMAHLNNGNPLLAPAGEQTFDGERALWYARSRFGSARGDFDRSERQRELMVALRNEVLSVGTFSNPVRVSQLVDTFGDNVRTNLSMDDVMKLYELAGRIDDSRVESIGLADPPHELLVTDMYAGQSVVLPRAGFFQYQEIKEYISSILVDGFIKRENPRVVILNGTNTPGLATTFEKKLSLLGYEVIEAGDAPTKGYEQTQFFSLSEEPKPYTERYMELRFKTNTERSLPDGVQYDDADFIIILGRNETINN